MGSQVSKARVKLHVPWLCKGQLAETLEVKQRLQICAGGGSSQGQGDYLTLLRMRWQMSLQKHGDNEGNIVECEHKLDDDNGDEGFLLQ